MKKTIYERETLFASSTITEQARLTLDELRCELLSHRTDDGHWVGELASSSLSTATAISAMSAVVCHAQQSDDSLSDAIRRGIDYLCAQQNEDGGFGDTDRSHSNIATSYLVLAASTLAERAVGTGLSELQIQRLRDYIDVSGGIECLRQRYGKDKTFVIPILTNMAIAGLVDWDDVSALPFEVAAVPQSMYRLMRMPVVSYAIPALVAIGQARHFHGKPALLPLRMIRKLAVRPTLKVLLRMQPESGGYLEATPLTAFVLMSLAATDRGSHPVSKNAIRFLQASMREDGSWPIDTNLATWVTSLSIHALACDPDDDGSWFSDQLLDWHLGCQHRHRHPFTGAEPGGWGWTDLSGAVPDGDDTPGAILALQQMRPHATDDQQSRIDDAIDRGRRWLDQLQNRDGGWPTFCRGWGKLPFDRSSTDLTAHAIRATGTSADRKRSQQRGFRFLQKQQRPDGSWFALWFGNQDHPKEENPVYGTAKVLLARGIEKNGRDRGIAYLLKAQNSDGGWGGGPSLCRVMDERSANTVKGLTSSVEETALAVDAICTNFLFQRDFGDSGGVQKGTVNDDVMAAIIRGVEFLVQSVRDGRHKEAWPIGFYFAKLWYHERLYPLTFSAAALGKFLRATARQHDQNWPQ